MQLRRVLPRFLTLAVTVIAALTLFSSHAHAATDGRLIDDSVWDNSGTMSATDIQNFLNQFPNSCLKSYNDVLPSADPTQAYFSYSGSASAATIIRRVADDYGVNPRVILTKLQQEQSLVTGDSGCAGWRYIGAMGFNCPDGQSCPVNPDNAGFSKQVTRGMWLLKMSKERANGNLNWMVPDDASWVYGGPMTAGNRKRCGTCATIYYDGYWNGILLQTGATASLYNYTPHVPSSFDNIFESWWGTTWAPTYAWEYVGQTSDKNLNSIPAGQKATWTLSARNTGTVTWTNSGPNPTRLAPSRPNDRNSSWCVSSWISCNRAAVLNESSVAPGQVGTFTFNVQAPASPGAYNEYFNIVIDGVAWLNDLGLYWGTNVVAANLTGTVTTNTLPTTLDTGVTGSGTITVRNDGNVTWYKDGRYPITIGTYNPIDRTSVFTTNNWIGANRPARMNESSVDPGQNATFTFEMIAPSYPASFSEQFSLVAEGFKWFNQPITQNITVTGTGSQPVGTLSANQVLHTNQQLVSSNGRYRLIMQSDGNLVLYSPNRPLWWTNTQGRPVTQFIVQGDGNLVLYDNQFRPFWASMTQGRGGTNLIMQDDGNLVLYTSGGIPLWYTRTNGQL